ncbi:hypothetical protein DFH09DRAFT_1196860 [Mycena vulgaris]|nr:hypothetical protein DFH09DRAFT_1196860 [Mycena vulgaris]
MASTVFGIQELCEELGHHIARNPSSHNDLKSAALVCQTLRISAQSLIFRDIVIDPLHGHRGPGIPFPTLEPAVAAARRLSAILTASPHLMRSIRSLSVLARSSILESLSSSQFPSLQRIRLDFQVNWMAPDDGAFHLASYFVGLPSLRTVELHTLHTNKELRLNRFTSLFGACTPNLESLSFEQMLWGNPSVIPPSSAPLIANKRTQIKSLSLVLSDHSTEWLISLSCPLDLTGLIDVEISGIWSPAVFQLLNSARFSIKRLKMFEVTMDADFNPQMSLPELPGLTCLEFYHWGWKKFSSLKAKNCIETIVVHLEVHEFADSCSSLPAIDSGIADWPLPALRTVEVRVGGRIKDGDNFEVDPIKAYFPQLHARGLVVVTDHRDRPFTV